MEATAALQRPQFFRIFQEALHQSWTAYSRSKVTVGICLAGALVFALFIPWKGAGAAHGMVDSRLGNSWSNYLRLQNVILGYAALASCIRLVRPNFGLTFGTLLGCIGYGILTAFLTILALLVFIVPGIYVGTRSSLTQYVYLLGEPSDALGQSWSLTRPYFWPVFLFCAGLWLMQFFVGFMAAVIPFGFAVAYPLTMVIVMPMAAAISLYSIYLMHSGLAVLTNQLLIARENQYL